jgi:hypothetical protein
MLNKQKGPDLTVSPNHIGTFYKFGPLISNYCLVTGTLERKIVDNVVDLAREFKVELEENKVHLIPDAVDVYMNMLEVL